MGPLVVGGFCISADRLDELVAVGAKDSKLLTPRARERVFAGLESLGTRADVVLSPRTVDRAVSRGGLNDLEADAFARLIRELAPEVAYVDACDPNERRFGLRVARLAGGTTRVIARHHADRDFPVVGAASIVAKVRRDRVSPGCGRGSGRNSAAGTLPTHERSGSSARCSPTGRRSPRGCGVPGRR